jgi:gamma-glutamylcyclotransferase (GGCT)/AIG2-like uncharacterized protein YtfP
MDLTLYFAFGSNLSAQQMRRRCPTARRVARATLRHHELAFGGMSAAWRGAVATVRPARGAEVEGLLYVMRSHDLARLDSFEGVPDYYTRALREVVDQHGTVWRAHVYALRATRRPFPGVPPSEQYVRQIREAYERNGFDMESLERAVRACARRIG